MTQRFNTKLLAAILNTQQEPRNLEPLSEERVRQALTSGPPLTGAERRQIWFSPDARDLFLSVRREVRLDMKEKVREAGLGGGSGRRLAASGGDTEDIAGDGFTVSLFRDGIPGAEWSISVQLDDNYRALLSPETTVVLRDGGGRTWAAGVPDSAGCISGVWEFEDETPRERLQRFSLSLDP